ncbi:MAG: hypothetical protein PHX62_01625 [Bacilli bacterium]|nr:hypothetical protein [Bacilli bacterium]
MEEKSKVNGGLYKNLKIKVKTLNIIIIMLAIFILIATIIGSLR